jgi:hypothetical protein
VEVDELRNAYSAILEVARRGRFRPPPEGWSAEMLVAHLASNDELFIAVTEDLLAGRKAGYDNLPAVTDAQLEQRVAAAGSLEALIEQAGATSSRLLELVARLDVQQASAMVPTKITSSGAVVVDQERSWGRTLAGQARFHLPLHLDQLKELSQPQP